MAVLKGLPLLRDGKLGHAVYEILCGAEIETLAVVYQQRAITFSLLNITSPLSLAVAGPVSDTVGLQMWFLVTGLISAATGIAGFFISAIVNIEENGHAQPESDARPEVAPVDAVLETSP